MKATIKNILLATALVVSLGACKKNSTPPEPTPVEVKAITIADLKALGTGTPVKVPDGRKISGVVISDASNKNIDSKTVVLQEASDKPGIIINFAATHVFAAGDQLEINISNQTLAQINGEVVLDMIPLANAKKTGTGTITANVATTADIAKNAAALNGTLVKVLATGLSGGNGTYKGTLIITDASGSISSVVLAGANFENKPYPALVTGITGIVRSNGNSTRLDIRNTDDLTTSITRTIVDDNFDTPKFSYNVNKMNKIMLPATIDNNLQASKKYIYGEGFEISGAELAGVRELSFDISYSKFSGNYKDLTGYTENVATVFPFTAGKDINQIQVSVNLEDNVLLLPVVQINDVGAMHTISIQIPKTKDDFKKILIYNGTSDADAETWAGDFAALKLTQLIIENQKQYANDDERKNKTFINVRESNPDKASWVTYYDKNGKLPNFMSFAGDYHPFAIGKIIYGFEK